jgi:hypothetical protein
MKFINNQNQFNKGISTPIGILIVLVLAILAGGIVIWQSFKVEKEETELPKISKVKESFCKEISFPEKPERRDWGKPFWAQIIVDFLNQSPCNRERLYELLKKWNLVERDRLDIEFLKDKEFIYDYSEESTLFKEPFGQLLEKDLDNDREKEIIISIVDKEEGGLTFFPTELIVIDKNKEYFLVHKEYGSRFYIYSIEDINKDGFKEIIWRTHECGAHTCGVSIFALNYDGKKINKITGDISASSPRVYFEDKNEDGILEIKLSGDLIGSAGAGTQRKRTKIYEFDEKEGKYILKEIIYDPPICLVHTAFDADLAFSKKEIDKAKKLYNQIIEDEKLRECSFYIKKERLYFKAYAFYKLMLISLLENKQKEGEEFLEILKKDFEDNIFTKIAQIFYSNYKIDKNFPKACKKVEEYAKANLEEKIYYFGYNNPTLQIKECLILN